MEPQDAFDIIGLFRKILDVNTKSCSLLPIAQSITLISYNAQISAARCGEEGKTLGVMTKEINALAPAISAHIHQISTVINSIGHRAAYCAGRMRRQESLGKTERLIRQDGGRAVPACIREQRAQAGDEVDRSIQSLRENLASLVPIFDSIRTQMRLAEIIGNVLKIEVGRALSQDHGFESFRTLSGELSTSCTKMRGIVNECQVAIQSTIATIQKPQRLARRIS